MGIECSAKSYIKLIDLIFCAQRSVLYPVKPLQNPATKELTADYERALNRIFWISDEDGDGFLDDKEIDNLQVRVFKGGLQKNHIDGLKQLLRHECWEFRDDEVA